MRERAWCVGGDRGLEVVEFRWLYGRGYQLDVEGRPCGCWVRGIFAQAHNPRLLRMSSSSLIDLASFSHGGMAFATKPSLVIFSGGTAFNRMVNATRNWSTSVSYIMPVSDDGGSTAEILRVLGGPAVVHSPVRSLCDCPKAR